ncbi:HRDC domain-containing protein [Clostridium beijerinckii]|uniref:HRDC domain-containing protein n=1 Tax=Clostridium beijerinckii TaxID=1520 RepID=UPI0015C70BC6|nr:superfamily II DNA helicase RecQ [Clostridium beijerinckii]
MNLIRKVLKEVFQCDNIPVRSLVIMANPKAIIRKKYAPEEIQNQIIRAEKLGNYIEDLENELRKTVFKEEMTFKIADYFKEKHTPINIDYEAKFGITEEEFSKEASINIVEKSICEVSEVDFNDIKNVEKSSKKKIDETVELSESDSQLSEKLKLYRNEKAKEEGYNALKYHYVFSGSTINNLVENKPKTTEQLFNIKGLGEVKINKYGNDILKIIEEHVANAYDKIENIDDESNTKWELEMRNQLKKFRIEIAKKKKLNHL